MNIKIIGVGKCGSRICYDFFAHITGLPSAYEIRVQANRSALNELLKGIRNTIGFDERIARWRREWQALVGTELLKDSAWYAILDSDVANNEITQSVVVFSDGQGPQKETVFPGTSHSLYNHTGGCDFHIVSENICQTWPDHEMPAELRNRCEAEIIAYSFSIGGGTGGGASPLLASKLRRQPQGSATNQVHVMGLGVLPESDQPYVDDEPTPDMLPHEKYNVGRFFTALYGDRNKSDAGRFFDSLWLVSNDALRSIQVDSEISKLASGSTENRKKLIDRRGISLVNMSLSAAICTLCNSSSSGTTSTANFDAMEMNNRLNGKPFISAFSHGKTDPNNDAEKDVAHVHHLFRGALKNPWVHTEQLLGLSVPQHSQQMAAMDCILADDMYDPQDLAVRAEKYRFQDGPVAFRTAEKVVVLYGQSESNTSEFRIKLLRRYADAVFPNSDISFYGYKHSGATEYLVLMIVNPFVPSVLNAMYYYLQRAWLKDLEDGSAFLDNIISAQKFEAAALVANLFDEEQLERDFLGDATLGVVDRIGKRWPFTTQNVTQALKTLHGIYHHTKKRVRLSTLGTHS